MEELTIKDPEELKDIVTGFLRRLVSKEIKTPSPKKRINLTKSTERHIERLKREGKIAPNAKITIIEEGELLPKEKGVGDTVLQGVITNPHPSVVDAYIKYLKREGHIEDAVNKTVESVIDSTELTPEEKELGKKMLGGLVIIILQAVLSLKTELRADIRDGHIAFINQAIEYARNKNIPPKEVFESDKYYKNFLRLQKVQGLKKKVFGWI